MVRRSGEGRSAWHLRRQRQSSAFAACARRELLAAPQTRAATRVFDGRDAPRKSATLRLMTTTHALNPYTAGPDEQTLADTVPALEEHGFSVEVVDDLDAARDAVLARIPAGSAVMTNTSVTLSTTRPRSRR